MSLPVLPEPHFIDRDPEIIEQEIFARWVELTEVALSPTQPEAIILRILAYRETLVRLGIQEASKSQLLRYAAFPMIDFIGELVGATRLDASSAVTVLQFTLPSAVVSNTLFPAGTRRSSLDGKVTFSTDSDLIIEAGDTIGTVTATATAAGPLANGYVAGQIAKQVDVLLPAGTIAVNTGTTDGGSVKETDARYLDRILLAPDAYSTAGSKEAYKFHALSLTTAILDVALPTGTPGLIDVVVLSEEGVPGSGLLEQVAALFDGEKLTPMSDTVNALACTQVDWELEIELTLFADADGGEVLAAALDAAIAYRDSRVRKLGRDIVLNQARNRVLLEGVYDAVVNQPVSSLEIAENEWANCTSVSVVIAGYSTEKMESQA